MTKIELAESDLPRPGRTYHVPSGDDLRTARELAGLTLREAAAETEFHKNTISRWECGRRSPRLVDARAVLQFYLHQIGHNEYAERIDGYTMTL